MALKDPHLRWRTGAAGGRGSRSRHLPGRGLVAAVRRVGLFRRDAGEPHLLAEFFSPRDEFLNRAAIGDGRRKSASLYGPAGSHHDAHPRTTVRISRAMAGPNMPNHPSCRYAAIGLGGVGISGATDAACRRRHHPDSPPCSADQRAGEDACLQPRGASSAAVAGPRPDGMGALRPATI